MVGTTDGQQEGREPSVRLAGRIAEAFELPLKRVLEDAELVADWRQTEEALAEHLQQRHSWDATMAPAYLFWLRGYGSERPG